MAQPQSQAQARFPPGAPNAHFAPSPTNVAATNPGQSAVKKMRLDNQGLPQQPAPSYLNAQHAPSPGAQMGSPVPTISPTYQTPQTISSANQTYSHFTNGHTSPSTYQPTTPQPVMSPNASTPQPLSAPQTPGAFPQYSSATLVPIGAMTSGAMTPGAMTPGTMTPGAMGPPLKPPERAQKEYQYDVDDSLAGTGIDLRVEEQYQTDYFAGSYRPEAKTGFAANAPGKASSFYGSGPANQPAQTIDVESQARFELETAKKAWNDSAKALATVRSQEIRDGFLLLPILYARAEKIAKEYGLTLMSEGKAGQGRLIREGEFPKPWVKVKTAIGPDGAMVTTTGAYVPEESYLADQLCLLSLSTNYHLRELVGEANKMATTRQQTSHNVPDEWLDVAAPLDVGEASGSQEGASRVGDESAVSPRTNPSKRTADMAQLVAQISTTNPLTQTLRGGGRGERDWEEARLRKRQKREDKSADPGATSRSGSVAPGTPGAVAPEPEKAPTKKEQRQKAAVAKAAEASNTTSANRTSLAFLGGRKKKQYAWMSQPASGASTPARTGGASQGLPGTPSAIPGTPSAEPQALTSEGRTKIGIWREDGEKGKGIQLRDWVVVLEQDGKHGTALQSAYDLLDRSQPR